LIGTTHHATKNKNTVSGAPPERESEKAQVIAEESQQLRDISKENRALVEFEEIAIEPSATLPYPFKAVDSAQLHKRDRDT
jgi:hypothetical protein